MLNQGWFKKFRHFLLIILLLFPFPLHASFIEATIGAAVVNDATATYFNPAALTLLKTPQIIGLGSVAYFRTQFTGQAVQSNTGFRLAGTSDARTNYFLPSSYLGLPTTKKITVGLAILSNDFSRDTEQPSILRYAQSNNHIENIDLVPAIGIKLNDVFAIGAGLNFSYAKFVLRPISGFPSLNIPDAESRNEASATSWGGDAGLLLKPTKTTLIGFNYRTSITYNLKGKSVFEGQPRITSNDYHFKFWTPARYAFTISQLITKKFALIATIQRIQWSIFKNINIFGIATRNGIVPRATVPYHLHDSWLLTFGTHYRITPQWVIRAAVSYIESAANGHFQISTGDNIVLGGSMSYEINKYFKIDGSYAHVFIENQNIHITNRNIIDGVNKGSRDSVSLKLTFNLC